VVRSLSPRGLTARGRGLRAIDGFLIVYVLLILYGSLLPFDMGGDWRMASRRLDRAMSRWPLGDSRVSHRDLLRNGLLYMPLGLLVAGRWLAKGKRSWAGPLLAATGLSAALSLGIEGLQLLSRTRMPALQDVIANTAGGLVGAIASAVFVVGVWPRAQDRLSALWVHRPIGLAAMAMAVLLMADALDPLYPVPRLSALMDNLRGSHMRLGPGLGAHPWHHWMVCRVGLYAVLTVLLGAAGSGSRPRWRWIKAAVLAAGLAAILETCKPFVENGAANVANVVTAGCGSLIGAALGLALAGRLRFRAKWIVAVSLLAGYIVYYEWQPFLFTWDPEAMAAKLPAKEDWIPLYNFALASRDTWEVRLLVRLAVVAAALTYAACLRGGRLARGSRVTRALKAVFAAGMLGLALEAGQFFLPGRCPNPSHVMFFAAGGAVGFWSHSLILPVIGPMRTSHSVVHREGN